MGTCDGVIFHGGFARNAGFVSGASASASHGWCIFFLKLDSWEGREKYHIFTNSNLLSSRWTAKCVKKVELCDRIVYLAKSSDFDDERLHRMIVVRLTVT